ncbi:Protein CBG11646 [Caenorhabditis briggsae]|uniref:Protein CBG11646 n=1 Tax=Caenorhabditis briggsae TaxID=6238 RepID=A8XDQ0_CAEBR|nr:Protein CBG11646 [Caenorhabditis briggsae]CAP30770.1 Protein CBG11646 [Caenorhabditis briggsae]
MHYSYQMQHPSNAVYDPTLRVYNTHPVYGYQQMMPVYQPIQRKEIQVHLKNQDQWKYLHESDGGNEMLLNINGKPLFPKIQCYVQNLDAFKNYDVGIKMVRSNPKQFVHDRYAGKWIPDEDSDVVPDKESNEVFIRGSGANLMRSGIDFGHVKIYNDKVLKANEVPSVPKNLKKAISCKVNLRCLYVPVMTIYEDDRKTVVRQFQFEETQFLAVSEYKNKVVKQFKIQNIKFVPGIYRKAPGSEQEETSEEAPTKRSRKRAAKVPVTDSKKFKGSQDDSYETPVNSMASTSPGSIQNSSGSPQSLSEAGFTNTSISSKNSRPSLSPRMTEIHQMMPPQVSTSSGAPKNNFEYGYDFSSTSPSSPESLNRLSTSPPMAFDENQDPMALQYFPDPIVNYSNPMDTNCSGNEYKNFYPMNGFDFNAPPNPYQFDFNNDYKF